MIDLQITSPPDREHLVVELWRGNIQLAEVSNEDDVLRVEFYAEPGASSVLVPLADLLEALQKARNNLRAHETA